jgi:5S rRNA maturation endonuclease (ribonuclease M5)
MKNQAQTFPKKTGPISNIDQPKLNAIAEILSMRYDELFEALGVSLGKTPKQYIGCCPVHGGDNAAALNIYRDGYSVKGYWKCRTHHCENFFKKTIIGFVRGCLSNQRGWHSPADKDKAVSFNDTIKWICNNFLKQDISNIKVDPEEVSNKKFVHHVNMMTKKKNENDEEGVPQEIVRKSLKFPAKFFIDKGYSKELLDRYDVGVCWTAGKEMYSRVVVPIYNKKKRMVGCTGRSINPKCEKCGLFHPADMKCPDNDPLKGLKYSKWRNSSKSSLSSHLYNYWNALESIKENYTIILVEGPADVWKLEELGIHNSVALLGTEMSDEQQVLIEMSGALNVIILLDMDKPGRDGSLEIKKRLERSYRVFIPEMSVNDPGDYTSEIVKNELMPMLKGLKI